MCALLVMALLVQDPAAHPKVDQKRVDEAIKKGVTYLKGQALPGFKHVDRDLGYDELVLWTYVHAGVPESDEKFKELLKRIFDAKLTSTYRAALQAMILEEVDRVKYQWRIHQCAQFLVDNQCDNGQWSYGEPSFFADDVPTGARPGDDVATSGGKPGASKPGATRSKPPVKKKIQIKKEKKVGAGGDNSNTQYAALGLRACHDAGIVLPKDVLKLGLKWWEESQKKTGGWCYGGRDHFGHEAYGSMTAGAVGSVAMYHYMLGSDWRKSTEIAQGMKWLADSFSVTANPGKIEHSENSDQWHYYYWMYALERAGILVGTETIGKHEWYPEGANVLLDAQRSDGSWASGTAGNAIWDTCFAILFLRRATRPLEDVATGGKK